MKQSWNELQKERERLPIFSAKHRLLKELSQLDNAIVIGETGSGKTTQIPQVFLISQSDTNCIYSIVMIYNVSPQIFGNKRENKISLFPVYMQSSFAQEKDDSLHSGSFFKFRFSVVTDKIMSMYLF